MNMGAYMHVWPRLETCLRAEGHQLPPHIPYAGRVTSASTATGYGDIHAQEQAKLISEALDLEFTGVSSPAKRRERS
jgi:2-oxoglutarate dehydrogenase E1 component